MNYIPWLSILTSITGWWFQPIPLKNDGVKVSWDDDSSQYDWKVIKNVPNHQSDKCLMDSFNGKFLD